MNDDAGCGNPQCSDPVCCGFEPLTDAELQAWVESLFSSDRFVSWTPGSPEPRS